MAHLAERLIPVPDVRSSIPVIGEFLLENVPLLTVEKTQIRQKETGNGPPTYLSTNQLTHIGTNQQTYPSTNHPPINLPICLHLPNSQYIFTH